MGASTAINGQGCSNQTRILVSRRRRDELIDGLSDAYKSLSVGDPLDPSTAIGPLVSERQRARVEGYITSGREEGAKIATGGGRPTHLSKGWFVEPTLFVDVDNHMRIAQEEIFGPVAVVIDYEDTDDAVRLANESAYGLSGSVWSADVNQAVDIARLVRTGTLTINGFMFEMNCPFGGFKASGIGREMGPEGLAAYVEHKTITVPGQPAGIFG